MKRFRYVISCVFVFMAMLLLSSCTVNIGALVVPKYDKKDWYCEELQITCLNKEFYGAGYALMDYNGKSYTQEYYADIDKRFDEISREDFDKTYSLLQGFINYDGDFYLLYSENTVVFDEQFMEYKWATSSSQELLIGDVKNHGSYIAVTIETDNLYNGEYAGKTIRFDKM